MFVELSDELSDSERDSLNSTIAANALVGSVKFISKDEKLSDEQRVLEVARMLSGSVLTDEAVANAKSLLKA